VPGFAKVADQLIARAYARQQRLAAQATPSMGGGERLGWDEAKQQLQRAIQRHGRQGREQALLPATRYCVVAVDSTV